MVTVGAWSSWEAGLAADGETIFLRNMRMGAIKSGMQQERHQKGESLQGGGTSRSPVAQCAALKLRATGNHFVVQGNETFPLLGADPVRPPPFAAFRFGKSERLISFHVLRRGQAVEAQEADAEVEGGLAGDLVFGGDAVEFGAVVGDDSGAAQDGDVFADVGGGDVQSLG